MYILILFFLNLCCSTILKVFLQINCCLLQLFHHSSFPICIHIINYINYLVYGHAKQLALDFNFLANISYKVSFQETISCITIFYDRTGQN